MKVYHGTTIERWASISKKGLVPRGRKKSNWTHASHPDMVYLSNAYAPFFGFVENTQAVVVIEVDLSRLPGLLLPDEDALAQGADPHDGLSLSTRTRMLRDSLHSFAYTDYDYRWSLKVLGTCCHEGTIPPSCFERVAFVDAGIEKELAYRYLDTSIAVMNFAILGDYWKNVIKTIFGDPTTPSNLEQTGLHHLPRLYGGVYVSGVSRG